MNEEVENVYQRNSVLLGEVQELTDVIVSQAKEIAKLRNKLSILDRKNYKYTNRISDLEYKIQLLKGEAE